MIARIPPIESAVDPAVEAIMGRQAVLTESFVRSLVTCACMTYYLEMLESNGLVDDVEVENLQHLLDGE